MGKGDNLPSPGETGAAATDQARECEGKGACEFKQTRFSDQIMPHILNLHDCFITAINRLILVSRISSHIFDYSANHKYGASAKANDFDMYAPNASFEDPLTHAQGVKQIKSAFYSLSKFFGESKIVEYHVQENDIAPGKKEILIDNKQHYKIMGKDIDMISLIKLSVENGKIVRHEDWWDKKPLRNRDTVSFPLVGRFMEMGRRGMMLATHAMMGFGKDPDSR
ncbi:hypothetical protein F2Q69_00000194 [Brassica cretica]|uniref:SnoaL-like domain-containing protein n=1 Tax=Brassica cretica TaxID=69181 RepID=A0A8S9NVB8_BRACR|nr:hypothetical protein F2Q69_00000194 [Brassica cretica]